MSLDAFRTAYRELHPDQKKAVDAIEGPVLVVAGPGTGKTQILTLRIANILLKTDTRPENILALTFTESGASAMRNRLRRYIGAEAYRVGIYTFHGFADMLIRTYPDAFPRIIGGRVASPLEKISIIETILEQGGYTTLRPSGNPSYYVTPLIRMLSTLKQEYITSQRLHELIEQSEVELSNIERVHAKGAHKGKVRGEYIKKERAITKNRELLSVYRQYDEMLRARSFYDFDDMIVETVEALRDNESFRLLVQETYQYVLADEHQDVNGSQNAILEYLTNYHNQPNIFVVGDEKQAIYRFQGASLENFLYFEDVFPKTHTIALTQNYRSGQGILDVAHSLISVDAGALAKLRVPLQANRESKGVVSLTSFSHQAVEDTWIVNDVIARINEGISPGELAIITRTNREVEEFTTLLRAKGVTVVASADGDILNHPITHSVIRLINALTIKNRESSLFELLHDAYWNLLPEDVIRITRARSYDEPLTALIADLVKLKQIGVSNTEVVLTITRVLTTAREYAVTKQPHEVLAYLITESGLLKHVMTHEPLEGGRVLRRLYDEITRLVQDGSITTLEEVQNFFATLRTYNLPLTAPYISTTKDAVQIMTAHKSKGLEFDYVYIPHVVDSMWGKSMQQTLFSVSLTKHLSPDEFDALDDERRLLYVALTRARKHALISYASVQADSKELVPSRLLEDIDLSLVNISEHTDEHTTFDPLDVFSPSVESAIPNTELFVALLKERGLSATSLNNFLTSPWEYVYRNALRIPEIQQEHLLYGTALHSVMEQVTKTYSETGTTPTDTNILKLLERALSRLPLSKEAFVRLHERGFASLVHYVRSTEKNLGARTKEEVTLKVALPTGIPGFPEVTLTGKLDRLDFDEDGIVVRVVDYKTGKPKSRNAIEGKTKNTDGSYKRQLVFYALLLSLYESDTSFRTHTSCEFVLSFIEANPSGNIVEESFMITEEELDVLKKEIIGVVTEILSGSFLASPCDETKTAYCHLARKLFSVPSA